MWRRFEISLARGLVILTTGSAASAMAQEGMPQQPDTHQLPGLEQEARKQAQQAMQTMQSERVISETDTVVKIDKQKRKLTLQDPQGRQVTLDAGQAISNFDQLREGDKVDVKYYQAVAVAIHKPGESAPMSEIQTGTARVRSGRPNGMVGETVTTTLSVVSVDPNQKQIALRSPDGKTQTLAVEDPTLQQNLSKLQAGDQVSISYTEAAAISVMPRK